MSHRQETTTPTPDPRWAYALVNLATLIWSTNFILGRLLRDEVGPFTLTAARFAVAAAIFAVLLQRVPAAKRRPGKQWGMLAAMGLTGVFGFGFLLYSGLRLTTASNASLINGSSPLIIGLLSALLLQERFTRRMAVSALLSLVGVGVIVSRGSLEVLLGWQVNAGDLLVLAAVATWGVYSILGRVVMRTRAALPVTALSTLFGLPLLLIAAALEWAARPPTLSLRLAAAVLYIGIGPSVVAFLAWNEATRRIGPSRVAAFYSTLPVYSSLLGVLVLGEEFGRAQLVGGLLVIAAGLVASWNDLRKPRPV